MSFIYLPVPSALQQDCPNIPNTLMDTFVTQYSNSNSQHLKQVPTLPIPELLDFKFNKQCIAHILCSTFSQIKDK